METPGRARLTLAFVSLIVARMVYAFNWYDVGPEQSYLATLFGVPIGEVSLSLWSFLFAVGVFQVPAGMLSLRIGARKTSLLGIAILGVAATASALVDSLWAFVVLRFLVGVGAALFFSPAMGLITQYYEGERRGLAFGFFNGAFSLGAGLAVFVSTYLSATIGAGTTLLIGGILMLGVTVENLLVLPEMEVGPSKARKTFPVNEVLRSRVLWLLALSLLGFWAANFAVAQYFVTYSESVRHTTPAVTGAIDALLVSTALVGGPIGGYLGSRTHHGRWLLAGSAISIALLILAIPWVATWALWPLALGFGVISGLLFGAMYLLPTRVARFDRETAPLSLGLLNSLQVLGGSFLVLLAGYYLFGPGNYPVLWLFLAAVCVVPLALMLGIGLRDSTSQTVL